MAATPNYASTPTVGAAILTAANSGTRAAPASGATIFSGGTNGGQVERIVIEPVATTASGTVQIYRVNGGNYYLYTEAILNPQTPSTTVPVVPQTLEAVDNPNLFPIAVPANWSLYAVLSVAQTGVAVQAEGGTY